MKKATAWLKSHNKDTALYKKVLDILHWDYDLKPYTLDDLLAPVVEPPIMDVYRALLQCGYNKDEAIMRHTVCEDRRDPYQTFCAGIHYRTRQTLRIEGLNFRERNRNKRNARKRADENYFDTYAMHMRDIPTAYKGIGID